MRNTAPGGKILGTRDVTVTGTQSYYCSVNGQEA